MRPSALLALALFAGCGGPPGAGNDYYTPDPNVPSGPTGTGKIGIQWTINNAAPTADSCKNVAELVLTLDYGNGSVTIKPIPCTAGRLRYDHLPGGYADIILEGYTADRCRNFAGVARDVKITSTVPDPFSPIIALAPKSCR